MNATCAKVVKMKPDAGAVVVPGAVAMMEASEQYDPIIITNGTAITSSATAARHTEKKLHKLSHRGVELRTTNEMHRAARERRKMRDCKIDSESTGTSCFLDRMHQAARERRKERSNQSLLKEQPKVFTEEQAEEINIFKPQSLDPATVAISHSNDEFIVVAQIVEESADIEAQVEQRLGRLRDEFIRSAVLADVVKIIDDHPAKGRICWFLGILLFFGAIIGVVGGVLKSGSVHSASTSSEGAPYYVPIVTSSPSFSVEPSAAPSQSISPSQAPTDFTCTLCPDRNINVENPGKLIPRFRHGDESTPRTCSYLVENAQLIVDSTGGKCNTDIQIFANYCGCPEIPSLNSSTCNFCPFGLLPSNLTIPVFNDTCAEMNSFVSTLSSEQCSFDFVSGIQGSAAYCGCPTAQQSCSLCPNGDYPSLPDSRSLNDEMTCKQLNGYISILGENECASLQRSMITPNAVNCGCPSMFCSLCPSGLVYDPDRISLSGDLSCRDLDHLIAQFSAGECKEQSSLIQINSDYCGCHLPEIPDGNTNSTSNAADPTNVTIPTNNEGISTEVNVTTTDGCALCINGNAPSDLGYILPGGGTCGDLAAMVRDFSPDVCALQQFAMEENSIRCCSVAAPAASDCSLCPNGSSPLYPTQLAQMSTAMTCEELDGIVNAWTRQECTQKDAIVQVNAILCGCSNV